jgi:dTDP-4-amino-4,6-dideoxygalactose transaminase
MDPNRVAEAISDKTKAIVPVHYAGVACDMDAIMEMAAEHELTVIEDAAQAIDSYYKGKPLGGFGDLSAFSFHETKNIISGEGGMLSINNPGMMDRAEIIWEKGTNRSAFFRGEVDKYGWVDIGSSFLPSEIVAAFLFAQIEELEDIQRRRVHIWERYYSELADLAEREGLLLPSIPTWATNNGHLFHLVCRSGVQRTELIDHLSADEVQAVFHYLPLHRSEYFRDKHDGRQLPNAEHFSDTLLRLPLYYDLTDEDQDIVIGSIHEFFHSN